MKLTFSILSAALAFTPVASAETKLSESQKLSIAIGNQIGQSMKDLQEKGVALDTKVLTETIQGHLGGKQKWTLAEAEMRTVIQDMQQKLMKKQQEEHAAEAKKNKEAGTKYLAENKKKTGTKTTTSGLQYRVIKKGKGAKPSKTDQVEVHYAGTLINGEEFDSSIKRGTPATFGVGQVIKGWTEALEMMPVGSKWELTIPSELAYGESGNRRIPPNSVLNFEVELLAIKKTDSSKQAKK